MLLFSILFVFFKAKPLLESGLRRARKYLKIRSMRSDIRFGFQIISQLRNPEIRPMMSEQRAERIHYGISNSVIDRWNCSTPIHNIAYLFLLCRLSFLAELPVNMSHWMTSGRSRLKARQNRSFANRAQQHAARSCALTVSRRSSNNQQRALQGRTGSASQHLLLRIRSNGSKFCFVFLFLRLS